MSINHREFNLTIKGDIGWNSCRFGDQILLLTRACVENGVAHAYWRTAFVQVSQQDYQMINCFRFYLTKRKTKPVIWLYKITNHDFIQPEVKCTKNAQRHRPVLSR
jgi:hypothetical protein